MPSVHSYPDASFKAGAGVNTTTAIYKAVYLSGDNEVAIYNTTTNAGKFIGILQDYANSTGEAVPVRLAGPTKAILRAASITAGNLVGLVNNAGEVKVSAGKVANATSGSLLVVGKCIVGSQGGTNTVCEINLQPMLTSGITTTVSS